MQAEIVENSGTYSNDQGTHDKPFYLYNLKILTLIVSKPREAISVATSISQ